MGVPQTGWFHGKSCENGWFGGTTILGNLHIGNKWESIFRTYWKYSECTAPDYRILHLGSHWKWYGRHWRLNEIDILDDTIIHQHYSCLENLKSRRLFVNHCFTTLAGMFELPSWCSDSPLVLRYSPTNKPIYLYNIHIPCTTIKCWSMGLSASIMVPFADIFKFSSEPYFFSIPQPNAHPGVKTKTPQSQWIIRVLAWSECSILIWEDCRRKAFRVRVEVLRRQDLAFIAVPCLNILGDDPLLL